MLSILAIDTGRSSIKVAGEEEIQFPSIISEWYERPLSKGGDYELFYNGKRYFVGELAKEGYCRTINASQNKIHEEMKVLFITAVAAAEIKDGVIVTGVPVDQHAADTKKELRGYLKGTHQGMINNKPFQFDIKALEICPEGAAAYWDYMLNNQGKIVKNANGTFRVIDIGSKTINVATIIDQYYLNRESFTLDYGCYDIIHAKNLDYKQFYKRIMGDIMQRWSEYKETDKVLFSGGGSLLLKDYIQYKITDNPVFANARGFYKLGVTKWR